MAWWLWPIVIYAAFVGLVGLCFVLGLIWPSPGPYMPDPWQGTPPLFVFGGHDLSIYDSLGLIEAGLEDVDVEDSVYEAFDSIGRVIRLKATGVVGSKGFVDIGKTYVDTGAMADLG